MFARRGDRQTPRFLRHASSASGGVAFVSLALRVFPFRVSPVDFLLFSSFFSTAAVVSSHTVKKIKLLPFTVHFCCPQQWPVVF